jgi:hypothetical protein
VWILAFMRKALSNVLPVSEITLSKSSRAF